MQKIRIAASLLAADFSRLAAEIRGVQNAGAHLLHLDIMDGHFVPNLTFGPPVVARMREHAEIPLDAHLMTAPTDHLVQPFIAAGAKSVTVHPESNPHIHRTLSLVRQHGASPGVALNPATPAGHALAVLDIIDSVLVMTVNPGFGGQNFIPSTLPKIREIRDAVRQSGRDITIAVDGGITPETAPEVVAAGARTLVAGTSVFGKGAEPDLYEERIRNLMQAAEQSLASAG